MKTTIYISEENQKNMEEYINRVNCSKSAIMNIALSDFFELRTPLTASDQRNGRGNHS